MEIKIYETEERGLICELWATSTKHPDCRYFFSDFLTSDFIPLKHQIFQWLLEIASKMEFPNNAKMIAEYALKNYVTWE